MLLQLRRRRLLLERSLGPLHSDSQPLLHQRQLPQRQAHSRALAEAAGASDEAGEADDQAGGGAAGTPPLNVALLTAVPPSPCKAPLADLLNSLSLANKVRAPRPTSPRSPSSPGAACRAPRFNSYQPVAHQQEGDTPLLYMLRDSLVHTRLRVICSRFLTLQKPATACQPY